MSQLINLLGVGAVYQRGSFFNYVEYLNPAFPWVIDEIKCVVVKMIPGRPSQVPKMVGGGGQHQSKRRWSASEQEFVVSTRA